MSGQPIALIGSPDALFQAVAGTLRDQGHEVVPCRLLDGSEAGDAAAIPFRIEQLGSFLNRLAGLGVAEACLVGRVARPRIDPSRIDAATMPLVPRMMAALGRGDDGALREVLLILEEQGFAVRAAQDLAPWLLPPAGALSAARPTRALEADAERAERLHRLLAPADLGQGVILRSGRAMAVEAALGTDWMLRSVRGVADGALFFKAPKDGQDRRADLPVIGPLTIKGAIEAGLAAVVVEAGGVMVLEPEECARLADAAGLVLWVRERKP